MKKLLSILAAVGLTASASASLVSCSKKHDDTNDDTSDGKEEIRKLIKDFQAEVKSKWASNIEKPLAESSTFVEKTGQETNFTFFQKSKLKQIYNQAIAETGVDEGTSTIFYSGLNDEDKDILSKNIQSLLSPKEKINNLKKSISSSTYQVLIGQLSSNWIDSINFQFEDAKINFTDKDMESGFIANLEIGYNTKYYYYDAEDTKNSISLSGNVSITISDDKVIIDTINDLQNKLSSNLMKAGNPLVWLDKASLNNLKETEIVGGSTEKYNAALDKHYKDLTQKLILEIKNNYFEKSESEILKNIKIGLEDPNNVVRNSSNVSKIGELKLERVDVTNITKFNKIDLNSFARQTTYFGKIKNNANITLGDESIAGDRVLYNDLSQAYQNAKNVYYNDLRLKYNEIFNNADQSVEENPNISDLLNTSSNLEQVTIKGINFSLANGYKQNLNDILIYLSVSVDKTSTLNENTAEGKTFAAYYKAIELTLNQFHKFYGISPSDIDQLTEASGATKEQLGLLFNMNGNVSSDFNIWDYWKTLKNTEKDPFNWVSLRSNQSSSKFTDVLNLNTGDVNASQKRNENFISNLEGTSDFKLQFMQKHWGNWVDLYTFDINNDKKNGLQEGIKMKGLINYKSNYELKIMTDLFEVSVGKNSSIKIETDTIDYFSDGDQTTTLIGKHD